MPHGPFITFRSSNLLLPAILGAATFTSVQIPLLRSGFRSGEANPGWFLNSGTSILTIAAAFTLVAAVITLQRAWPVVQGALALTVGAATAMTLVLFSIGAGNMFPIVIVLGSVIILGSTLFGAVVGFAIQRVVSGN